MEYVPTRIYIADGLLPRIKLSSIT